MPPKPKGRVRKADLKTADLKTPAKVVVKSPAKVVKSAAKVVKSPAKVVKSPAKVVKSAAKGKVLRKGASKKGKDIAAAQGQLLGELTKTPSPLAGAHSRFR